MLPIDDTPETIAPLIEKQLSGKSSLSKKEYERLLYWGVKVNDLSITESACARASKKIIGICLSELVESGSREFVELLAPYASRHYLSEAIKSAASQGKTEIVAYFLDNVGNVSWASRGSAIKMAYENGHIDTVNMIVEKTPRKKIVSYLGDSIGILIRTGQYEKISDLLSLIVNKEKSKKITAMNNAIEEGLPQVLRSLTSDYRNQYLLTYCDFVKMAEARVKSQDATHPKQSDYQAIIELLDQNKTIHFLEVIDQNDQEKAIEILNSDHKPSSVLSRIWERALEIACKHNSLNMIVELQRKFHYQAPFLKRMLLSSIKKEQTDIAKHFAGSYKIFTYKMIESVFKQMIDQQKNDWVDFFLEQWSEGLTKQLLSNIFSLIIARCRTEQALSLLQKYSPIGLPEPYWRVIYTGFLSAPKKEEANESQLALSNFLLTFVKIEIAGIAIADIINDKEILTNADVMRKLLSCKDEYSLIETLSQLKLITGIQEEALHILLHKKIISSQENQRAAQGAHYVENDKLVTRANKHFNEVVKPHFQAKFESFGKTNEECINAIELKIRELILDYIEAECEPTNAELDFIKENRNKLVAGDEAVLRASTDFFSRGTNGHYAWFAYHPYIQTHGSFKNLLVPQRGAPVAVYTTRAAINDMENINNHTVSNLVRERVAYYYLAVTDPEVSVEDKANRVVNFINKLQEILNAYGPYSPSCFPGHIHRIGEMGNFHPVAQLPEGFSSLLETFFKAHIVSRFSETLSLYKSLEEKEALLFSIIMLNSESAMDFVLGKQTLSDEQYWVRRNFLDSLGSAENLMLQFGETSEAKEVNFTDKDIVYFQEYLLDPALNSLAGALTAKYQEAVKRPATQEEIEQINPFNASSVGMELKRYQFFEVLIRQVKIYHQKINFTQLVNFQVYFEELALKLTETKITRSAVEQIANHIASNDDDKTNPQSICEALLYDLQKINFQIAVQNPFRVQMKALQTQMDRMQTQPTMRRMLEQRMPALETKATLFDSLLSEQSQLDEATLCEMVEEKYRIQRDTTSSSIDEEGKPKSSMRPM